MFCNGPNLARQRLWGQMLKTSDIIHVVSNGSVVQVECPYYEVNSEDSGCDSDKMHLFLLCLSPLHRHPSRSRSRAWPRPLSYMPRPGFRACLAFIKAACKPHVSARGLECLQGTVRGVIRVLRLSSIPYCTFHGCRSVFHPCLALSAFWKCENQTGTTGRSRTG